MILFQEGNVNPPLNRGTTFVRTRKGVSQKIRTPAEDRRYVSDYLNKLDFM